MPIPRAEFRTLDENESPPSDPSPDTCGTVYRFLLDHADRAFRRSEIVETIGISEDSIGLTLERLERHGLVEHRGRFWAIADAEHAVASAGLHAAATADAVDGSFSDTDAEAWMETAVEPIADDADTDEDDAN